MELLNKIEDKSATIGVIGLGYVGLPLAINFVNSGFDALSKDEMSDGIQHLCAEAGLHAPLISLQHVVKAKTPEQVAKRGMEMSARLYQYQVVDKVDAKPHEGTVEEPAHRRFARR